MQQSLNACTHTAFACSPPLVFSKSHPRVPLLPAYSKTSAKVLPAMLPAPDDDDDFTDDDASVPPPPELGEGRDAPELRNAEKVDWDEFLLWWHNESRKGGRCCCALGGPFQHPRFERAAAQIPVSRYPKCF